MCQDLDLRQIYSYKSIWLVIFKSMLTLYVYVAGKRKSNEMITNLGKKQKTDVSTEHPPFYYNIHRHSIKGMNMPK